MHRLTKATRSDLSLGWLELPGAPLGAPNPLPPFVPPAKPAPPPRFEASVSESDRRHFAVRHPGLLPYTLQDDFTRRHRLLRLRVAVLENRRLRATFLLDFGGRLWSLRDKQARRELLHTPPFLQPANIALRGAWFCGGVEWNAGRLGHSPFTCAPVFAARARGEDGTPVLRLYEWDRVGCFPYQLDCWLPPDAPFLFVRGRIINPHAAALPMYWWSNIAVPETAGTRVLAPARHALRHAYDGLWRKAPCPRDGRQDFSRPLSFPFAADIYHYFETAQRPWIAALEADGRGLVHASTARLRGRKLFVWGAGRGGRRWQAYLSGPGRAYLEIQGGLSRTQYEYLPMPAGSQWAWLEAYGLMETDPRKTQGRQWDAAWRAVEARLDAQLPAARLEAELILSEPSARHAPEIILHRGSGWGALECRRRRRVGAPVLADAALPFDAASLGPEQAPWLALLARGVLPQADPRRAPLSYMVQSEWRALLETSLHRGGAHWAAWLQRGVMCHATGDVAGAVRCWRRSLARAPSAWALRNLAAVAAQRKQYDAAVGLYRRALALQPDLLPLVREMGHVLAQAGRARDTLALCARLPHAVRARLALLETRAALEAGDLARAERVLATLEVADLREGDTGPADLWYDLQARRMAACEGRPVDAALLRRVRHTFTPPPHLDFGMRATE